MNFRVSSILPTKQILKVTVMDWDPGGKHDVLGSASMPAETFLAPPKHAYVKGLGFEGRHAGCRCA